MDLASRSAKMRSRAFCTLEGRPITFTWGSSERGRGRGRERELGRGREREGGVEGEREGGVEGEREGGVEGKMEGGVEGKRERGRKREGEGGRERRRRRMYQYRVKVYSVFQDLGFLERLKQRGKYISKNTYLQGTTFMRSKRVFMWLARAGSSWQITAKTSNLPLTCSIACTYVRTCITLSLLLIACIKFSDFEQVKFSVYQF